MGRKRKQIDSWMPARVYRGKSAYEFHPPDGGCIRVCGLNEPQHVVIQQFGLILEQQGQKKLGSIEKLVQEFFGSVQFQELSVKTRKEYEGCWRSMKDVFGEMDAKKLRPEHVRMYMDEKGRTFQVTANRHLSFLSRVFSWGYERGKVPMNPCKGVRKFREKARTRYVTDEEYSLVYDLAPIPIKAVMEISYLCAAREADVLKLRKDQLKPEGIFIKQGKTGKEQIKAWTPRLKAAIQLAGTIETKISTIYVIPTKTGTAYTVSGFQSNWQKLLAKAREQSGKPLDFTFHDLKAKGVSDYEGNKQEFSGHKTASQVAVYDRKTKVVATVGGEKSS